MRAYRDTSISWTGIADSSKTAPTQKTELGIISKSVIEIAFRTGTLTISHIINMPIRATKMSKNRQQDHHSLE